MLTIQVQHLFLWRKIAKIQKKFDQINIFYAIMDVKTLTILGIGV